MKSLLTRTNGLILLMALVAAGAGYLFGGQWRQPTLPPERGPAAVEVGEQRPDLALPDTAGQTRTLSEWDGKLVLVNFWASWCPPCREEMPDLDAAQQRHGEHGLQVLGIATDDHESVHRFLREFPVGYPILIEEPALTSDAAARFGNNRGALPFSVLISRDGRILAQHFGKLNSEQLDDWIAPHL